MTPTLAATVIVLRDAPDGMEVLLLQRHGRSGFMPDMWVFPGGRVEQDDHGVPPGAVEGGAELLRLVDDPTSARAIGLAAVRETFEESGLWLGSGAPDAAARAALVGGTTSLPAVLAASGARIHLDALAPWARWVTPEGEGRRFDASFLVAFAPMDNSDHAVHDAAETVASGWFRPADALAAGFGAVSLAPPTFWVLHELAALGSIDAVRAALPARDLRPVQPVRGAVDGVLAMLLPGDPGHPEPRRGDLPTRLDLGAKQWIAVH